MRNRIKKHQDLGILFKLAPAREVFCTAWTLTDGRIVITEYDKIRYALACEPNGNPKLERLINDENELMGYVTPEEFHGYINSFDKFRWVPNVYWGS